MTQEQEIQFSVETLTEILRHEHRRRATGAALRNHIHKQLVMGIEPNHYRMEWLRDGVNIIIGELRFMADNFNKEHPNDAVGVGDMLDVLTSSIRTIANKTGYNEN
jgi:hypothetical protein